MMDNLNSIARIFAEAAPAQTPAGLNIHIEGVHIYLGSADHAKPAADDWQPTAHSEPSAKPKRR